MSVRPLVTIFLLLLALANTARAQTYIWDGGAGTSSWLDPLNWNTNTLPIGGSTTTITLAGTTQTVTAIDPLTAFMLNQLRLDSSATGGFTVGGKGLIFAGTKAGITFNGAAGSDSGLRISAPIDFGTTNASILTNSNAGSGGTYFEIILDGPITGTGSLTKGGSQPGELILNGQNGSFSGTYTNSVGQTQLAAANALGRQAVVVGASGSTLLAGSTASARQTGFTAARGVSQALGSLEGAGLLQIGHSTGTAGALAAATVLVGFNDLNKTYNGTLTVAVPGSQLAKVGSSTWELTATSTSFFGNLSVRGGTLLLDSSGALSPSSTTAPVGGTTILGGATLRLDNATTNNQNRLQNNGSITLAGGTLRLDGNNSANTSEVLGGIAVGPGQSTIVINPGTNATGSGTQFNIAPNQAITTFAQSSATGTVFIRGQNLGAFSSSAPPSNTSVAGFVFATPTLINATLVGGGSTGANTSILPWALATSSNGLEPDTFATYDLNGIRPLVPSGGGAEYATFAAGNSTTNVRDGSFSVAGALSRNALVATGGTISLGADLTLTSGALLTTGSGTTIQPSVGGATLRFGSSGNATGYITTTSGTNLAVQTPVAAANLSKSGDGTLTLQAAVSLSSGSTVAVNAGKLAMQSGAAISVPVDGSLTYQIAKRGVLDVTGLTPGLILGDKQTLIGNGSVLGSLTVASGATLKPDALAGPGTLTVDSMTWQPGGTYTWQASSAITDPGYLSAWTGSRIVGTGSLNLSGLSAANKFKIDITSLGADNSTGKALYDLDTTKSYHWTIASFVSGITGFNDTVFTLDTTNFVGSGTFYLQQSGSDLVLSYGTPIVTPEPLWILPFGAITFSRLLRRRFRSMTFTIKI